MIAVITAIVTAHLVVEFVLTPKWARDRRREIAVIAISAIAKTALSAFFLGDIDPPLLMAVAFAHVASDLVRLRVFRDSLWPFLLAHAFIFAMAGAVGAIYPRAFDTGRWPYHFPDFAPDLVQGMIFASGFLATVHGGGEAIRRFVEPFDAELKNAGVTAHQGLKQGGYVIGCLERTLVFIFVLADQLTAVGVLIAAKSVLRFGEIKDAGQRKTAEAIIIGTFASFGWALVAASLTARLLKAF